MKLIYILNMLQACAQKKSKLWKIISSNFIVDQCTFLKIKANIEKSKMSGNILSFRTFQIVTQFVTSKVKSIYHLQMWRIWLRCCKTGKSFYLNFTLFCIFIRSDTRKTKYVVLNSNLMIQDLPHNKRIRLAQLKKKTCFVLNPTDVAVYLPCWLSQLNWNSQEGRDRQTSGRNKIFDQALMYNEENMVKSRGPILRVTSSEKSLCLC